MNKKAVILGSAVSIVILIVAGILFIFSQDSSDNDTADNSETITAPETVSEDNIAIEEPDDRAPITANNDGTVERTVFEITKSDNSELVTETGFYTLQELQNIEGDAASIFQDQSCGGAWSLREGNGGSVQIYKDNEPSILTSLDGTVRYVAEIRNSENIISGILQCHSLNTFETQQEIISELQKISDTTEFGKTTEISVSELPALYSQEGYEVPPYTKAYTVDSETEFGGSRTYIAFTDLSAYFYTTIPNDGVEEANPSATFIKQAEVVR